MEQDTGQRELRKLWSPVSRFLFFTFASLDQIFTWNFRKQRYTIARESFRKTLFYVAFTCATLHAGAVGLSRCVRLSVARRYCIKTAARIDLDFGVRASLELSYHVFEGNFGTSKYRTSSWWKFVPDSELEKHLYRCMLHVLFAAEQDGDVVCCPGGMRSIVMSMSVCLSVCLPAYITRKPYGRSSPNLCVCCICNRGSVLLRRGIAIRYVLPVLRMTSYFHTTGSMGYRG